MKRLLSLTVALLAIAVGAWAQHFTIAPPLPGGQSTETVVEAKLVTGTTLSGNLANYEIAALVDGNVRAIVTGNTDSWGAPGATAADYNYFVFRIPGNFATAEEDNGKAITFKMYNSTTGLEYDLSSPSLTFDGKRHGTTSSLFELSVTEVTGISLNQDVIYMNWDEQRDLTNNVNLLPSGATKPNNQEYTYVMDNANPDMISISEAGILSAVEEAASNTATYGATVMLGSFSASFSVKVLNHVTAIDINEGYETITVNVGDDTNLQAKLEAAFTVTPDNTTDTRTYASDDTAIVSISVSPDGTLNFNPVAAGTTTVSVAYTWSDGTNNYATATETVTVKVVQPVTGINVFYQLLECNVGDDLTEFIKQYYEVLPNDATDKSVTYEVASGSNTGIISIEGNTITAVAEGSTTINVRSVSNPDIYGSITVTVHDWATSVELDRDSYHVTYFNEDVDISKDIFGIYAYSNGQWTQMGIATTQPAGKEVYSVSVVSNNSNVVEINTGQGAFYNGWGATVKGVGTATLTFTLTYLDYLTGTPLKPVMKQATSVLSVVVSQGPTGFSFNTGSITMNVGETINLKDYVTLQPEGASVADNDYIWTVQESDGQYMSVTGNTLQALAPNIDEKGSVLQLQLNGYDNLGTKDISVYIYQPASSITVNTPTITVNKNDWETLKSALESAVTVNPTNHTDEVVWTSDDEEYIAQQEVATEGAMLSEWVPIKGGQTTMTVKVGTTTYNAEGNPSFEVHATQQVTVNINVPIESITLATGSVYVNAGDDLTDYLNSIITILPEDATNKSYHFVGNNRIVVDNGRVTLPTAGLGQVWAVADDGSGVESNKKAFGAVNQAKDVTFAKDITVKYTGSDVDISEEVKANITFDPANASRANVSVTSSDESVATVAVTIVNNSTNGAVTVNVEATAKAVGETTVTMAVTYIDYLTELMDATGAQHRNTVERSFKIIVSEGLSGFEIAGELPSPMAVGQSYTLTLTPQPEDAEFDPSAFEVWINGGGGLNEDFADIEHQDNGDGTYTIEITPNYPSSGTLVVNYNDGTADLNVLGDGEYMNVGVPTTLTSGWQWKTLWGPISNANFGTHFSNSVVDEIRSQTALMANDPVYGYYGELYDQGLQPGVAYKINATTAVSIADAAIQVNGEILQKEKPQTLQKAWTWIGNPYVLSHPVSAVITSASEGDRIVSKENGFAEYSGGAWTGSLTTLVPWQSYLYYNNSGAEKSIRWSAETDVAGSRKAHLYAPRKVSPESAWQYDPRPYRDNMSMVAEIEGVTMPDLFTIGAFVDDECRGEGVCIDGRMFITVHANQGEQVSFRLRNEVTGEQFDVDQTVRMQLMLGTLKAPFRLSSQGVATGINSVHSSEFTVHSYDLGGRAVKANDKGMTIQRRADGTVRKVVRK